MITEKLYRAQWPRKLLLFSGIIIFLLSLFIGLEKYFFYESWVLFISPIIPVTNGEPFIFLLCGISLITLYFECSKVAKILGIIISGIAGLMIIFDIFGMGIFHLILPQNLINDNFENSMKVTVNADICFMLAGFIFWGVDGLISYPTRPFILGILSSLIIAISAIGIIGYASGVETSYLWINEKAISFPTDIEFLWVGASLLFYSWTLLEKPQSYSSWISLPISICILTISICFAWVLSMEQSHIIKTIEAAEVNNIRNEVEKEIQKSQDSLEHMSKVWTYHQGTPQHLWEDEVKLLFTQLPGLEQVLWVNSLYTIVRQEGNPNVFKGSRLLNETSMDKAKIEEVPTLSGIYDDNGKLIGMAYYLPLKSKQVFDGYLVAIFDIRKFFNQVIAATGAGKNNIIISHSGDEVLGINQKTVNNKRSGTSIPIDIFGLHLEIKIQALNERLGKRESYLPILMVLMGFLTVILVSSLVYSAHSNKKKALDYEKIRDRLQRAHDTIIEQDRLVSLGTLTAGIAHEVKNPLNLMKNFADLSIGLVDDVSKYFEAYKESFKKLDRDTISENLGTIQANLTRISEHGKRANNTVQRMLAHSRGSQEYTPTDIHSLLDEYLNLSYYSIRVQDPAFNVKLIKKYDTGVSKINVNAEDLSRVFLNLFNNAFYALMLKLKKSGTFSPELVISTQYINGLLEIRIRDNGCGIPESVRDRIFKPFFTTKPKGKGTGLGLSLSQSIVQEHQGTLDFISKEGEFTEFHITLPIQVEESITSKKVFNKNEKSLNFRV